MRYIVTSQSGNLTINAPATRQRSTTVFARLLMSALAQFGLAVVASLLPVSRASAVDREWNQASGVQVFNTGTNWTPNGTPVAGDNLTFPLNGDVDIFLGAPSVGNNITFSDGIVEFLDVGGSVLNNGGVATIDDPSAANLLDGAFVTLDAARWDSAGDARIGSAGAGTVTVQNGGDFEADQFLIGDGTVALGEVTVTGSGSTLNASLTSNVSLYAIGINGGTGTLHVLAGGDITTTSTGSGDISIGEGIGSTGTLNIDGAGSTAESEDIWVGHGGTGFLNVTNGGVINLTDATAPTREFIVARTLAATGDIGTGAVLVSGDNSLISAGPVTVGLTGVGTATISGGGRINAGAGATIGGSAGSSGMLTVTGVGSLADSTFAVTGNLLVGQFGQGTLRAELGGNITVSTNLVIGDDVTNTSDNSVTIDGAGSLLTVGNILYVGNEAVGNDTPGSETTNSLSVTDGATASTVFLRVAEIAGSKGEMLVDGAGSSFTATNDAVVGTAGTGKLEITSGAVLTTTSSFWAGFTGSGNGAVTVNGPGSQLNINSNNASHTFIGGNLSPTAGGTGTVVIENGGFMSTTVNLYLGSNATGNGVLVVRGPGSRLDSDDLFANEVTYVGYANRGAFSILDGASVDSELVRIGELSTAAVDEAVAAVSGVNGTASTWNVRGDVVVGNSGVGALNISAGGRLISNPDGTGISAIGNGATSNGSSVLIIGAGSKWTDAGGLAGPGTDLYIGNSGGSVQPTTLNIHDGGALESGRGVIARLGGSRADVIVTGNGARWDATSFLIGNLSNGSLTVSNDGDVHSTGEVIIGNNVSGAQHGIGVTTVTGSGSTLISDTTLTVGRATTTDGMLGIEDGGAVTNTGHGSIAALAGSLGAVNVGNGSTPVSTWTNGASLFVGGSDVASGGIGTLNVNDRGSVSVANELKLWANGHVVLNGGTVGSLTIKTLTRVAGSTFDFQSGKLAFLNNAGNNRILDAAALTDIFNADHTIAAGKTLQILGPVTLSAPLRLNGGTYALGSVKPGNETAFAANLDWDAGTLQFTDSGLNVGNAGLFGPTLLVDTDQTLLVGQSLTIDAGAELVVAGDVTSGGMTNNGDLVAVGATIDGPVVNNSAVTIVGTVDFNGLVSGPGDFFGPGTANFNGGMSPGASPAEVNFEGSVALADTNSLFIEIGGTMPGSQHDALTVTGMAALDGIVDVALINDFTPTAGQQFTILSANSITDNGLVLGGPAADSFDLLVGSTSVILEAISAGLPGDYNGDGTVDTADYVLWRRNDGTQEGYDEWRDNFGPASGSGYGVTASQNTPAVPEPSAFALLFPVAFGAWIARSRRRRPSGHSVQKIAGKASK